MPTRPRTILPLVAAFAPVFSRRVWRYARVLAAGALLTPGQRTVAAALRVVGLADARRFERYHRVLNRACWSSVAVSRILLNLLVAAFVPDGPIVVGVDETIERRRGAQIAAKGIYRDAVRSSRSHFVKASGLRWVSLMLLAPIPWAGRVWALPFLTALAPSERSDAERGRRTRRCPTGRGSCSWWCGAGTRRAPSSPWPIAPTPPWSSWPPAAPGPIRSPSSPGCARTLCQAPMGFE
jgi:hypothetical protein